MNIILQHWDGTMPDWAKVAQKTMMMYAAEIGCDYELVTGTPVGKIHGPYSQKIHHLNEKYDKYDQVLMLDMDTIATNVYDNVFARPEIGVLHDRAMKGPDYSRTPNGSPFMYERGRHVFFGNFIKLKTTDRVKLREHLDWDIFAREIVDHYSGDEIIMHYLLHKSNLLEGTVYEDVCMRTTGTSVNDHQFREHNRYDRLFCNQPEDSSPEASIIHFCASRKRNLIKFVHNTFKGDVI